MRSVKRWRYFCDYCKKSGGSKWHMERHENGCTLNPERICGLCSKAEEEQQPITKLVSILPDPKDYECVGEWMNSPTTFEEFTSYDGLTEASNFALKDLRKATSNCPACIMAAIRQAGIKVPIVSDFDFAKELESFWSEVKSNEMAGYSADY